MIQGRWITNNDDSERIDYILNTVYEKEIKEHENFLHRELDDMANHVVAIDMETGDIVGYGRVTFDLENFVIDNVAVLPEHRRKYYGDFIVRILVDKAISCAADAIYCAVPDSISHFIESIGFKKVSTDTETPANAYIYADYNLMCLRPADFHSKCKCH